MADGKHKILMAHLSPLTIECGITALTKSYLFKGKRRKIFWAREENKN
jgi:hypothetical protein